MLVFDNGVNRREWCRRIGERAGGRGISHVLVDVSIEKLSFPSVPDVPFSLDSSNSIVFLLFVAFFFISECSSLANKKLKKRTR